MKNEKIKKIFKNILMFVPIFLLLVLCIFGSFSKDLSSGSCKARELKTLEANKISKKSLVSAENNDFYAYLYLDFSNEVYISADIYYSYSVDETSGELLAIIVTADYEYTDWYADYTYTNSYTYSVVPKINNNTDFLYVSNLSSISFEFSLIRYQTSYYILPIITIDITYFVNGSYGSLYLEGNAGFDKGIIINNTYQWDDTFKRPFNIIDGSFDLFNLISDSYYNAGYDIGFDAGRDIGFDEGIDYQKDLYEQSGNVFDNIWEFLEKGISAVLAVFAIEILPGIPLSICIIVPLVFGIIFFIWKGGAQ